MNLQKITNLADGSSNTDALNIRTADNRYYPTSTTLDQITAPSGNVSLNSHRIIDLATPTDSTDGVTKAYIDNAVVGI
jgi:hypothetical protein